ncbi:MAG: ATP-binding cassette domain-containing protein [Verrucomicrobiota bacterium]
MDPRHPQSSPNPIPDQMLLKLEDVTLRHGNRTLFPHTTWSIHRRQHWAILGDKHSGGAVLGQALAQKVQIQSGQITYFLDYASRPHGRRFFEPGEVVRFSPESFDTLLFQGYQQARWQSFEGGGCPTAADLLNGQSIENRSPFQVDPQRVEESIYIQRRTQAAHLLGIEHLLHQKMLHLSTGERRKVLIVRALMQEPALLILDDPCGGLDPAARTRLLADLSDLIQQRTELTLVVVATRPEEVPHGIDHFAIVHNNRLACTTRRDEHPSILNAQAHVCRSLGQLGKTNIPLPNPIRTDWLEWSRPEGPLITVTNATVRYGEKTILENLSWEVRPGEHWALMGPNGAGKSTLLSLILGDSPQTYALDIRIAGRKRSPGTSVWELKRKIGFVCAESHAFHPANLDCLSIVLSGLHGTIGLHHPSSHSEQQQAEAWLQILGVRQLTAVAFGSISLEEQRLVLLARALVGDPALLILDEICQSLAADTRLLILSVLKQLCRRRPPLSLLFVTHHQDEIPEGCNRVLHLAEGKIAKIETLQPAASPPR